ncbi:hypothetical protein BASA81_016987 [Batrachochytrium salamandrivorans]|nr:hypothetical protein BASA81_016987 [Batrachochytrium salamandrivorans]
MIFRPVISGDPPSGSRPRKGLDRSVGGQGGLPGSQGSLPGGQGNPSEDQNTFTQLIVRSRTQPGSQPTAPPAVSPQPQPQSQPSPQPQPRPATPPPPSCFKLSKPSLCPQQDGAVVFTTAQYSDTTTFDEFIKLRSTNSSKYVGEFQLGYDCPSFAGKGTRFHTSLMCSLLVDISTGPCSVGAPKPVNDDITPLCRDTCMITAAALKGVFDSQVCSKTPSSGSQANRKSTLDSYASFCSRLTVANTAVGQCLDGSGQPGEGLTCGFSTSQESATFCTANPNEPCCARGSGQPTSLTSQQGSTLDGTSGFPSRNSNNQSPNNVYLIAIACCVGCIVLILGATLSHYAIKRVNRKKNRKLSPNNDYPLKVMKPGLEETDLDTIQVTKRPISDYSSKWQSNVTSSNFQRRKSSTVPMHALYVDKDAPFYPRSSLIGGGAGPYSKFSMINDVFRSGSPGSQSISPSNHSSSPSTTPEHPKRVSSVMSRADIRNSIARSSYARPSSELVSSMLPPLTSATLSDMDKPEDATDPADPSYSELNDLFMRVFAPYEPTMPDELLLNVDDTILVYRAYDDGWAFGRNISTSMNGVFPVACAEPTSQIPSDGISITPNALDGQYAISGWHL